MNMLFDIKYAVRMLLKKPQFTSLSVLIMAVGIGLCVFMMGFLSNLLYKEIPFKKGDELYMIQGVLGGERRGNESLSLPDYEEIKQVSRSFSEIGAYRTATIALSNGESSRRYTGTHLTADLLRFIGSPVLKGRGFNDDDFVIGSPPVTIISHHMWKEYFEQKISVLGTTVKINDITHEVIGVMPAAKLFPVGSDLWLPATDDVLRIKRADSNKVAVFARKLPDVTVAQANTELANIMERLAKQYPETNTHYSAQILTIPRAEVGDDFDLLSQLMISAVVLVLILACINVTNLLLTRANERSKETAVRLALGAPRLRLIVQMMWESVLICLIGGLLGIFIAAYGIEILNDFFNKLSGVPFWWYSELDSTLMLQALALIFFTAFITGIMPAWKMTRCNVNTELRDGTRGAVGKKAGRMSRVLVVIEVALSCILLIASGVLYVTLEETKHIDYGATVENTIQVRTVLPRNKYETLGQKEQYFNRLLAELAQIPHVAKVGGMSTLPGSGTKLKELIIEGHEVTNHKYPNANQIATFADSMQTLGIKLQAGRYFDHRDTANSQLVAIVTDSLAKKYWPEGSPIGKRFKFKQKPDEPWITIVGVANHVIYSSGMGTRKLKGSVFLPFLQDERNYMSNFVMLNNDSGSDRVQSDKLDEITRAVANVDPLVPTYWVYYLEYNIRQNSLGITFIRDIFTVFAFTALFLAATGIYGVLSNTTSRRTQELGIRRALGSTDANVMKLLMKQGWTQLFIGLLIGIPVGYLVSLGLVKMVVPTTDSYYYVYVFIPLIIAMVVSFSTYFPARKAIKLPPSSALRYE